MKVKISAGFSGVIATGSYENARPSYIAEVETELNTTEEISLLQRDLQKICYDNFKRDEEIQTVERINKQRADFHWIEIPEIGKKVPSVTSCIGFDSDYFVSPEELQQYASQSNIAHAQVAEYISTGKWVEPKMIKDCWSDIVICSKGSLKLPLEGWDFLNFLEKFPISKMENAKQSYNIEYLYGGTPDFFGIPKGWNKIKGYEEVKEVPTVFDIKRTKSTMSNGKQLSAYAKMKGNEKIEQGIIVELNAKTQQGWSKPEFYDKEKLEGYFKMFLKDREAFKKRFGV